jgi:hypothetical protein
VSDGGSSYMYDSRPAPPAAGALMTAAGVEPSDGWVAGQLNPRADTCCCVLQARASLAWSCSCCGTGGCCSTRSRRAPTTQVLARGLARTAGLMRDVSCPDARWPDVAATHNALRMSFVACCVKGPHIRCMQDARGCCNSHAWLKTLAVLAAAAASLMSAAGHYTIEGCATSQYEQHVRAVLGWPLGSTDLKVGRRGSRRVCQPHTGITSSLCMDEQ